MRRALLAVAAGLFAVALINIIIYSHQIASAWHLRKCSLSDTELDMIHAFLADFYSSHDDQ